MPASDWSPPPTDIGLTVNFTSDDNRQQKTFNFATLQCHPQIQTELAQAFSAAVGPLGTWRREASANGLWTVVRKTSSWLTTTRPTLTSLAHLSTADTRALLNSMRLPSGDIPVGYARALFTHSGIVGDEVMRELARHRARNRIANIEPYTEAEWRVISAALRGIIRRARGRITQHQQLVSAFRAGEFASTPRRDPLRCTAEVLDHYLETGNIMLGPNGRPAWNTRIAGAHAGRAVKSLIHLTAGECWAFGALLVGLTGLNPSTVFDLPTPDFRATSPEEPGIVIANAVKFRRGPRAAMTVALAALPTELHPPGNDHRPQRVLDTSLTTPFGVLAWLTELTAAARHLTNTNQAFVFYNGLTQTTRNLSIGAPKNSPAQRRNWLRHSLNDAATHNDLLVSIDLRRLRRTHLVRHRRPVAQTSAMHMRYLLSMPSVTTESFQIVREALDEQVHHALDRRRMKVETSEEANHATSGQDTVLGECADFDHSPYDDGNPCRQTFLTCLDCANARAFPRHLPFQLAVLNEMTAQRAHMTPQQWALEYAGRVAQLQQITVEFSSAQQQLAHAAMTDQHRELASRLLRGELDPI